MVYMYSIRIKGILPGGYMELRTRRQFQTLQTLQTLKHSKHFKRVEQIEPVGLLKKLILTRWNAWEVNTQTLE